MRRFPKTILIILVLSLCGGCDQATKNLAQETLPVSQTISYLGGIVQLQYAENTGAMLGLGATLPPAVRMWTLIVINGVMLAGLLWVIWKVKEMTFWSILGSTLVIGGGISNIYDRLVNEGAVIDFMHIGLGNLRTGIFNVADAAIMVGFGLIILWSLQMKPNDPDSSLDIPDGPDTA